MLNHAATAQTCNARTRAGTLCPSTELLRGGRCRLHGGASTGPRTLAGKIRSALNCPGHTYDLFLLEREARQLRDKVLENDTGQYTRHMYLAQSVAETCAEYQPYPNDLADD